MPFDPLATTADLTNRGITWAPEELTQVDTFLQSASDEVRNAAGVPISRETFTVEIPGGCDQWLHLPSQPVVSVSAVDIDGVAVTDHKLIGGHLWRLAGWQPSYEPVEVAVALTSGLVEIPIDIVDLVCYRVGAALNAAADGGYGSDQGRVGTRIDDYSEQYDAAVARLGPLLPDPTRQRLRARFGGNTALVTSR